MKRSLLAAAVAWLIVSTPAAHADFEISLREGQTVIAKSYRFEGDKLIAYQPAGEVQIDRARIVNIRDRGADPPPHPARAPRAVDAPARAPQTVSADAKAATDPEARERQLSRAIILAYRDLMFAQNRGESKEEIEKRKAEIKKLEAERASLGR
ncbi:MAG: hypothetical protein HYY35_10605 [Deltaproteobacteria bacterium]|nr:hypothetical protein [Deltaproteobacteria bacterium]